MNRIPLNYQTPQEQYCLLESINLADRIKINLKQLVQDKRSSYFDYESFQDFNNFDSTSNLIGKTFGGDREENLFHFRLNTSKSSNKNPEDNSSKNNNSLQNYSVSPPLPSNIVNLSSQSSCHPNLALQQCESEKLQLLQQLQKALIQKHEISQQLTKLKKCLKRYRKSLNFIQEFNMKLKEQVMFWMNQSQIHPIISNKQSSPSFDNEQGQLGFPLGQFDPCFKLLSQIKGFASNYDDQKEEFNEISKYLSQAKNSEKLAEENFISCSSLQLNDNNLKGLKGNSQIRQFSSQKGIESAKILSKQLRFLKQKGQWQRLQLINLKLLLKEEERCKQIIDSEDCFIKSRIEKSQPYRPRNVEKPTQNSKVITSLPLNKYRTPKKNSQSVLHSQEKRHIASDSFLLLEIEKGSVQADSINATNKNCKSISKNRKLNSLSVENIKEKNNGKNMKIQSFSKNRKIAKSKDQISMYVASSNHSKSRQRNN